MCRQFYSCTPCHIYFPSFSNLLLLMLYHYWLHLLYILYFIFLLCTNIYLFAIKLQGLINFLKLTGYDSSYAIVCWKAICRQKISPWLPVSNIWQRTFFLKISTKFNFELFSIPLNKGFLFRTLTKGLDLQWFAREEFLYTGRKLTISMFISY